MIHANNVNKFNIISSYGYHKIFNQDVDSLFVSLSVSQSVSHSLENMIWQIFAVRIQVQSVYQLVHSILNFESITQ